MKNLGYNIAQSFLQGFELGQKRKQFEAEMSRQEAIDKFNQNFQLQKFSLDIAQEERMREEYEFNKMKAETDFDIKEVESYDPTTDTTKKQLIGIPKVGLDKTPQVLSEYNQAQKLNTATITTESGDESKAITKTTKVINLNTGKSIYTASGTVTKDPNKGKSGRDVIKMVGVTGEIGNTVAKNKDSLYKDIKENTFQYTGDVNFGVGSKMNDASEEKKAEHINEIVKDPTSKVSYKASEGKIYVKSKSGEFSIPQENMAEVNDVISKYNAKKFAEEAKGKVVIEQDGGSGGIGEYKLSQDEIKRGLEIIKAQDLINEGEDVELGKLRLSYLQDKNKYDQLVAGANQQGAKAKIFRDELSFLKNIVKTKLKK